eukprot:791682-Karenia_brevis.AAC.1
MAWGHFQLLGFLVSLCQGAPDPLSCNAQRRSAMLCGLLDPSQHLLQNGATGVLESGALRNGGGVHLNYGFVGQ